MKTHRAIARTLLLLLAFAAHVHSAPLSVIDSVEWQPFAAAVKRLVEAVEYQGSPLPADEKKRVAELCAGSGGVEAVRELQTILDAQALFGVNINPEMRVKVVEGAARPELTEQGWRQFLVKVHNEAGVTAPLVGVSPNAASVFQSGSSKSASDKTFFKGNAAGPRNANDLWLEMKTYDAQPMMPNLSGLLVEYRIVQLYSRDAGQREAKFSFNVGQGTQDIGFRNETDILFTCAPAHEITLGVKDEHGKPTTASFLIRDAQGRVYPSQAKRLAPDFAFHPQVYRADGEKLRLPEGTYTIAFERGPESLRHTETTSIASDTKRLDFKVKRWIDPSTRGWWSGDHHIHAAGCAHYTNPTEGVHAPDMLRHCMGEDLKVGCNLTWGPCFDYQKQFFTGADDKVSTSPYLLHYDVEVSGFGSHKSGHLCLLLLREQMYPGGDSSAHWPTLGLNTLRWAKKQGALTGPAHSGWGLQPLAENDPARAQQYKLNQPSATSDLPTYLVPPFNGIGANEYIADVTHEVPGPDGKLVPAVDFMSTVDTPARWELNIWYHTLNAGFRTRISGETDFPCIYGERVGLGRSYVKLDGKLEYRDWCEAIRVGRNYVSDGRSHIFDFTANTTRMGENGSELKLDVPAAVKITAQVAARLAEQPDAAVRETSWEQKPFWSIERARIGDTRTVPVELLVNGFPVAKKIITADGALNDIAFETKITRSSWLALRILPSSHTNPIFVIVGGQPIREKKSIDWCLKSVDQCWSQKEATYDEDEKEDARQAYDHARAVYRTRLAEAAE